MDFLCTRTKEYFAIRTTKSTDTHAILSRTTPFIIIYTISRDINTVNRQALSAHFSIPLNIHTAHSILSSFLFALDIASAPIIHSRRKKKRKQSAKKANSSEQ